MNYRTIDMKSYPRRAHFVYFRRLQNPMMGVTVNVDVTALRAFCRARSWPRCSFNPKIAKAATPGAIMKA